MNTNLSLTPGVHEEEKLLFEIGNSEKQLWALIHSKGLLHSDAQDLYRKVRSSYERIILNGHTHSELQDAEYSLWKLHYKHIDEFRKIIQKSSGNVESRKSGTPQDGVVLRNNDNHLKLFKSFLSQAIEFYQKLIVKLREHYGVSGEALFHKKGCICSSVEADVMLRCQYLCHRCLVCMGDLARYKQQCENPDVQNRSWSVAATHYLEATRIWPDSGNPQNQLAVLATYIGDEFLALYHCVRSLAVKEPFPDAWNNLIMLFEKNRLSQLQCAAREVCFDFLKPSGRIIEVTEAQPKHVSSNGNKFEGKSNHSTDTKLWSLIVRSISFFFITSSLEEFPIVLASTIEELDKMLELDDIKLKTMLESYTQMDIARKGPFRALQVVSIIIFALKDLTDKLEKNKPEDKNDKLQLSLSAAFTFMGRFVERCLKSSSLNYCPLLPSVLIFVEWCSSMLDAIEVCATDQKSRRAISYFFDVFVELLNQLNNNRKGTEKILDNTPLWEDYELRGFIPVACSQLSLDFCGNWKHVDNFESGSELRTERIREAAIKIAGRSSNLTKWIITCDDVSGKKFYAASSEENHEKNETERLELDENSTKREESNPKNDKDTRKHGKGLTEDNPSSSSTNGKSNVVEEEEEEEVILFRPLTRYNSEPSHPSIWSDDRMPPKDKDDQSLPSDDCLRRATSLLMAQNPSQSDPWEFHGDIINFRSDKSFKKQEHSTKESNAHTFPEAPISAGPPSLNAWVLDKGSFSHKRNNGTNGHIEHKLEPINEIPSSVNAGSSNFHYSPSTCSIPIPSAPLLPDNATWYRDVQSSFPAPLLPHNTSQVSAYSDWSSTYAPQGHDPRFQPFSNGRMTSSEWLHWYRENYKTEWTNNYMQPSSTHSNAHANHENLLYHDSYKFNPLSYNTYMEPPPLLQPGIFPSTFGSGEQKPSHFNNFERGP
ncbi:PREDICTED: protein SMG7L-like isoform X3 [Lupinus angustifolius]|uniref:protein SMG7L-like isoform X3 n=1 Tax=Lupinus angustifolius TaxID=3871 RepID=UPI00092E8DF6|nr:PREDICTED: protein SMG7L-like isoform X3 [Lupinus angustifolius]